MEANILLGREQKILAIPLATWKQHLDQIPQHSQERLNFMTEAHHQIRYFVVQEMVSGQKPVEPELISEKLKLPLERVKTILEELESGLFFLVRNDRGAVAWAYPVTVEATAHKLYFRSGERLYGAWAEDAVAAPFVQGRLINGTVSAVIETQCAHCGREMHLHADSDMQISIQEHGAQPLLFMPDVEWNGFTGRTIIDAYWRNSLFFWSEEHARQYRVKTKQVNGTYLTLEQCALVIPIAQSALFAFD